MRRAALALLALGLASTARADVFSPGDLTKAHAALEGLRNCTKCHEAGEKLSPEKCLSCHQELKGQLQRGSGFHGNLSAEEKQRCEGCHQEHQGREFHLIDWIPSKKGFQHFRTGWPLTGKHQQVECDDCHQRRLIAKEVLDQVDNRATFLGLPTVCARCHFDEHRAQLEGACDKCHNTGGWRPAPGFDHGKTDYPLTGRHRQVACAKCHESKEDTQTPKDAFPAPKGRTFLAFADVPHDSCTNCHKDPHDGRFGQACESCHTTAGWKNVKGNGGKAGFHDKTRFPLEGLHAQVNCKACHGPFPGQKAKFRGLPFGKCTDCHVDAHLGQLKQGNCDRCHTVDGFEPARFELEDHARSSYPLEGAHRAVDCGACHKPDRAFAKPLQQKLAAELAKKKRPVRFAFARFDLPAPKGCESCHADPHQGQFARNGAAKGCTDCHSVEQFRPAKFDHARDAGFALTGKHADTACASCHQKSGKAIQYRGVPTTCEGCHADVHAGQFAQGGVTRCERCHDTAAYKPALFQHRPPFTDFLLDGKHAAAKCEACHLEVKVTGAGKPVMVRRYRPLPKSCEGCHADFHRGAFEGFTP